MNKTFVEVTAIIADSQKLSALYVPNLLRRVRLFDSKGLLPVVREETGRREGRLGRNGAILAAIYNELLDAGFDVEMCRRVQLKLTDYVRPVSVNDLVAVIGSQEPVTLVLQLTHNTMGEKVHSVAFEGVEKHKDQKALEILKLAEEVGIKGHERKTLRAETRLNLNQLLAPVIAAYAEG